MSVTRLSGGLTPPDGSDPRTFPSIWNNTAGQIETAQGQIVTLQGTATLLGAGLSSLDSTVSSLSSTVSAQGGAISAIQAWGIDDLQDVALGTALVDGQVLAYSTAIPGWTNATGGAGGGKILQVVTAEKSDAFSTSSTSFVDVTGLSVSITPSSVNSKILVLGYIALGVAQDNRLDTRILRDSTAIAIGNSSGVTGLVTDSANLQNRTSTIHVSPVVLDSPGTASSVTYKFQIAGGGATNYVNRRASSATPLTFSSITVMEVAA
jgi:hypothetical protein